MTCKADGCDKPETYGKNGWCAACYRRQRKFLQGRSLHNTAGTDLGARVADLRLAVEMASARVTQAVLLLEHPDLIPRTGRTPADLLHEALTLLDDARNR